MAIAWFERRTAGKHGSPLHRCCRRGIGVVLIVCIPILRVTSSLFLLWVSHAICTVMGMTECEACQRWHGRDAKSSTWGQRGNGPTLISPVA